MGNKLLLNGPAPGQRQRDGGCGEQFYAGPSQARWRSRPQTRCPLPKTGQQVTSIPVNRMLWTRRSSAVANRKPERRLHSLPPGTAGSSSSLASQRLLPSSIRCSRTMRQVSRSSQLARQSRDNGATGLRTFIRCFVDKAQDKARDKECSSVLIHLSALGRQRLE
jgi:hypothetical protein